MTHIPCKDCMKVAICCHLTSGELIQKCDDARSLILEGSEMKIEDSHIKRFSKIPAEYQMPTYTIKLNQKNVDLIHSYFRKVRACI